jgi:large subunit ribosomal protein L7/L12
VATRADALLASVRFINQPLTASNRKEAIMAKLSTDELLDAFKEMTLIELSEFVKQFEETFEVTAAAPVAVAAAGGAAGGAAAEEAEEQSEFDVVLTAAGEKKIQVIKEVRALTSLGLKEAKDLVDGAPKPVLEKVDKAAADKAKEQLEAAGASVELK